MTAVLTLPEHLLGRVRWVFLLFSLANAVIVTLMLAFVSTSEWTIRVAALFPLAFLAARYVRGYRRGSFSPMWDVPEALVLFVVLAAVGPEHGLGLLYVGLYFRSLYGSLGPALVRALLYFGAFAGAMALAAASPAAILSARVLPHAIGLVAVACVMNFLATVLGKHERAMSRERVLSKAGAALSAAVGREDVYEATLGAALELIGETPGDRVGLAVSSEEGMTVVASAGYRAEEIRGDRFNVHALPEPLRTRLLEKEPVEVERLEAGGLRRTLGLASEVRPFFAVPLFIRERLNGVIGVTSDSALSAETKNALAALGTQVSLALEGITLAEDLHRRQSEARFRSLVQNSSDVIMIAEADGTVRYVSPSVERILGYKPEDLIGTNGWEFTHPDELQKLRDLHTEVVDNPGPAPTTELRVRHRDGSWRYIEETGNNLLDDPNVGGFVFNLRDITERKRAEEKLRSSEERFRLLVEGVRDYAIFMLDPTGRIQSWNEGARRIKGYSQNEILGEHFSIFYPQEDVERVKPEGELREAEAKGVYEEEGWRVRKDGSRFWASVLITALWDEGGQLRGFSKVTRDITERKRAEAGLRESETSLAEAQRIAHLGSWDTGPLEDGVPWIKQEMRWSDEMYRILGYAPQEFVPTFETIVESTHPQDRERVGRAVYSSMIKGETSLDIEHRILRQDGEVRFVQARVESVFDENGEPLRKFGTVLDITERKQAEEELRKSEARNRAILDATPDVMFRVSREGEYLDFHANEESKLYVPREGIVGKNLRDMMPPDLVAPMLRRIVKTLDTGEMQVFEYQLPVADGALDFEARFVVSGPEEVLSVVRDVTERKTLERQLEHQAFHDALTGLPNRALFMDRLEHALTRVGRPEDSVAVLFMDLDNFKYVNDSLGHELGDRLLVAVAERLRTCLRPQDTLARLGGDEFVILLEDVKGIGDATGAVERTAEVLTDPFALERQEVFVTASVGISFGRSAREQPGGLLRSADLAMYRAKEAGKARYEVFDPDMNERVLERLRLESELRRALERDELRVYYQPKVLLNTNPLQYLGSKTTPALVAPKNTEPPRVVGIEALVRWEHPERGLVSPVQFIPTAEESGLIIPIGRWVLEEACRQAQEWQERFSGDPPLEVCVNLSAKQFLHPELAQDVSQILRKTGLEADMLVLEITESVLLEDVRSNIATLEQLRGLGIHLAIDDFGMGYSSLSYLRRLPVNNLKIDRSFIAGLSRNSGDKLIVSGVINLAQGLGLTVVAEGVETAEQLALLREMGCDKAQGNYFCVPLPGEAAQRLLVGGVLKETL